MASETADAPPIGTYEESRIFGSRPIQGGAPNNFLMLKNEKMIAPFNSTGKKGWLSLDKGKFFKNVISSIRA
jgi:hypothetical protein